VRARGATCTRRPRPRSRPRCSAVRPYAYVCANAGCVFSALTTGECAGYCLKIGLTDPPAQKGWAPWTAHILREEHAEGSAEHAERSRGQERREHVWRGRGEEGALPRARRPASSSSIGSRRSACRPLCASMAAASAIPAGGSTARRSSTPTSVTDGSAKERWSAVVLASPEAGAAREGELCARGRGDA
jgi:hypothetical protein